MNTKSLQETIRKVLKEELNESTYLRRRVDMSSLDKKFFTNLNIVTDKYLKRHDGYCSFNVFRTTVISYLIDDYRDNLSDEDYDNFPYDEVYNFLFNLFYDKIKDRYVEVFGGDINESEHIRKVLREERSLKKSIRNLVETKGFIMASQIVGSLDRVYEILGLKGTQDDMIFIVTVILNHDIKEKICKFFMVKTYHSIKIYVETPSEDPDRDYFDPINRNARRRFGDKISITIYELGNKLVRGHDINIQPGSC